MKIISILFALILVSMTTLFGQENTYEKSNYTKELSQRFLKLGNTYREAQNFDKANYNLTKGINLAKKYKQKYWIAVGYEYQGYLQRDLGQIDEAKELFLKAKSYYDQVIRQSDGSQNAIIEAINSLDKKPLATGEVQNQELTELRKENHSLKNSNTEFKSKIINLEEEIKSLKSQISVENNQPKKSQDNKALKGSGSEQKMTDSIESKKIKEPNKQKEPIELVKPLEPVESLEKPKKEAYTLPKDNTLQDSVLKTNTKPVKSKVKRPQLPTPIIK